MRGAIFWFNGFAIEVGLLTARAGVFAPEVFVLTIGVFALDEEEDKENEATVLDFFITGFSGISSDLSRLAGRYTSCGAYLLSTTD